MKNDKIINKLCVTVARLLAETGKEAGFSVWPAPIFSPVVGEIYVSSYLLPTIYDDLLELEKKGYDKEKIARLLKNPSRIAQLVWTFHTLKLTELSEKERVELVLKTIDLISAFRRDPFCEDGRNIIWSKEKIDEVIRELNWVDLNKVKDPEEYRQNLGALKGVLWLLCELFYFDFHGAGHEFHGPYELESSQMLVIREFYDLKPDYFPFATKLPFDKLTIFEILPMKEIKFDFFNRIRSSVPLSKYLLKFYVEREGEEIRNLSDIKSLINSVEKVLEEGTEFVSKLGRKELLKKFGEAYFFIIKQVQKELGKDWWPPESFYQEIEKGTKEEIIRQALAGFEKTVSLPEEEFIKAIASLFDPRD